MNTIWLVSLKVQLLAESVREKTIRKSQSHSITKNGANICVRNFLRMIREIV